MPTGTAQRPSCVALRIAGNRPSVIGTIARHGHTEATTTASPEVVWRIITDVTRVRRIQSRMPGAHWKGSARTASPRRMRFRGTNRVGASVSTFVRVHQSSNEARALFAWKLRRPVGETSTSTESGASTSSRPETEHESSSRNVVRVTQAPSRCTGCSSRHTATVAARSRDDMQRLAALAEGARPADAA